MFTGKLNLQLLLKEWWMGKASIKEVVREILSIRNRKKMKALVELLLQTAPCLKKRAPL